MLLVPKVTQNMLSIEYAIAEYRRYPSPKQQHANVRYECIAFTSENFVRSCFFKNDTIMSHLYFRIACVSHGLEEFLTCFNI